MVLLHHVSELVSQQLPASTRTRRKLPSAKHNVASKRVSQRINGAGRFGRSLACVDPYTAEILLETTFEKGTRAFVQSLTRRAQHVIYHRWRRL
jgi:hypothetical protein